MNIIGIEVLLPIYMFLTLKRLDSQYLYGDLFENQTHFNLTNLNDILRTFDIVDIKVNKEIFRILNQIDYDAFEILQVNSGSNLKCNMRSLLSCLTYNNCTLTGIDLYNFFIQVSNKYSIEEVAKFFYKTVENMEKVILCFGDKIPVINLDRLPEFNRTEKLINIIFLGIFSVSSLIGNLFLLILLMPFNKYSNRFSNRKKKFNLNSRSSDPNSSNLNGYANKSSSSSSIVMDIYFWSSAFFDLNWSLIVIPFHLSLIVNNGKWKFGDLTCKIYSYFSYLILCMTSFTLLTISVDRYISIVLATNSANSESKKCFSSLGSLFSLKKYSSSLTKSNIDQIKYKAFMLLTIFCFSSLLLALPYLLYTNCHAIVLGSNCLLMTDDYICLNIWSNKIGEYIYKIIFFIFIYIFPGLALFYSYTSIALKLFFKKSVGFGQSAEFRKKSKKRVIKVLMFDCLFYIIAWFPFSFWALVSCFNSFIKFYNTSLSKELPIFIYLYTITISNVSLKWLGRVLSMWPRIKKQLAKCPKLPRFTNFALSRAFASNKTSIDSDKSIIKNSNNKVFSINLQYNMITPINQ
jgi:hypothetical protein